MAMHAELRFPEYDKNFSIHFHEVNNEDRKSILNFLYAPEIKDTRPFLQGDDSDWMMIEFWTDNLDTIITATEFAQEVLGIEVSGL